MGSNARMLMSTAATIAIGVMTSMPSTQWTVAVDLATVSVMSRTRTADQKRPPPSHSRARSHLSDCAMPPSNPSGRPSSRLCDTDRIPGPHEAREVISAAHDIKVDVLAQIEAWVRVGPAKAGGAELEDDERRALAEHRLQQSHPGRVRAGGDHRDRAARQAANSIPRERLGERSAAVGLAHREVVEDHAVLAHSTVRLQDSSARVVGDEPDLAAAAVHLRRHRGGEADRILDRGFLVLAEVHGAVEVEEDPEVGGKRLLERLGHEPLVLGRKAPVDAAEAIARVVVAHAACFGRVVRPGAEGGGAAHLLSARRHQVRHGTDARVDEYRGPLRELQLALEEAERLAHAQRGRPKSEPSAAPVDAARFPTHELTAQRDDASGLVVVDLAEVADLDPGRRYPTLAPHLKRLFVDLTDRRRARVAQSRHRQPADGKSV